MESFKTTMKHKSTGIQHLGDNARKPGSVLRLFISKSIKVWELLEYIIIIGHDSLTLATDTQLYCNCIVIVFWRLFTQLELSMLQTLIKTTNKQNEKKKRKTHKIYKGHTSTQPTRRPERPFPLTAQIVSYT